MSEDSVCDSDVTAECELEQDRETVFRALLDSDVMDDWLEPPSADEVIERELIEAEPNSLVRYSWRSTVDERVVDSVVTFTLVDAPGGGTRLTVVHTDFVVRELVAVTACGGSTTMRRAA
jgi:uncharacterized protein YndB with AHSA1/START domain